MAWRGRTPLSSRGKAGFEPGVVGARRPGRIWRIALGIAIVVVLAGVVAYWLWRDLPRRRVESGLEQRLGADVDLGRLSILGAQSFILHDLVIRRMASQPRLAHLRIGTLYVTGSLGDILDGTFESLRAVDLEARLAPPSEPPPAPAPGAEPIQAKVGRLVIERGRIVLGADEKERPEDVVIAADGSLTGVGGPIAGEIRMRSALIGLAPLARAVVGSGQSPLPGGRWPEGSVEGFEANVLISEEGRRIETVPSAEKITLARPWRDAADATAREGAPPSPTSPARASSRGRVEPSSRQETLTMPHPEASILIHQDDPDGPWHVEIEPKLSFLGSASIEASLRPSTWELLDLDADIRRLDLAPILSMLPVLSQGWTAEGEADFEAHGNGAAIDYAAEIRVPQATALIASDSFAVEGLSFFARGSAPLSEPPEHQGSTTKGATALEPSSRTPVGTPTSRSPVTHGSAITVEARLDVASVRGSYQGHPVPSGLFPIHGDFNGHVETGSGLALDGRTIATVPEIGRLVTQGHIALSPAIPAPDTVMPGASRTPSPPALNLRWELSGIELGRLVRVANEADLQLPASLDVGGAVSGSGTLAGAPSVPHIAGELKITSLRLALDQAEDLEKGAASLRFEWMAPKGRVELREVQASGHVTLPPLAATPTTLSGAGAFDPSTGELVIAMTRIEAPSILRAGVEGRARLWQATPATRASHTVVEPAERAAGTLTIEAADLSRFKEVLKPLIGDPTLGYSVEGTIQGQVTGALAWNGTWTGHGTAATTKSSFSSEDGSQVIQGLDTQWALALSGDLERAPLVLRAAADVGGFELLWGGLYVAGRALTSKLEVTGEIKSIGVSEAVLDRAKTAPWSIAGSAAWSFPEGPRLQASIESIPDRPLGYHIVFDAPDLTTTVERYLREPLGNSVPWLAKVAAAGSLHVEGGGAYSESARTFDGKLTIAQMRLAGTEGLAEVQGLDLDLPVDIRWEPPPAGGGGNRRTASAPAGELMTGLGNEDSGRGSIVRSRSSELDGNGATQASRPVISGEPREGRIRFARLTVSGLEVPALATAVRVRADSVSLVDELPVKLLGGTLVLQQMRLASLLGPDRRLEAAVRLEGVRVDEATKAFGLPTIAGTVEGHFPSVRMTPTTLQVDGGGEIQAFGGRLQLGKISGEDILSHYPKITVSAEFDGIDLGQVTRQFDFGEITGIVRGSVKDCVLFGGVPVAFEALVETEERKGVSRTVNVKAIKNLTILGTGTSTNIFDRGIQKFFDKYTYSRIGVQVTLQDDQMILRGLERSGDRELFVKGRLPFPINVVNAQPGVAVSFQDMVERLKSLDLGSVKVEK